MANASPCMPSGAAMAQVFFPPGGTLPSSSALIQQGTPITIHSLPTPGGFPVMELTPGHGGGAGAVMPVIPVMPTMPQTPAGVSFIIQIGLTRESVLMPQAADLAYVKQMACSIVDTKVRSGWVFVFSPDGNRFRCKPFVACVVFIPVR